MYSLLSNKLVGLLVNLCSEISASSSKTEKNGCKSAHLIGTLLRRSSSISSSFICRSRIARYSHSRKSCSTSCQGRAFSARRATFTLAKCQSDIRCRILQVYLLASNNGGHTSKVVRGGTALAPHANEKPRRQGMYLVKVHEKRLECSRRRVCAMMLVE